MTAEEKAPTCGDWVTHMTATSRSVVHPVVKSFQAVGPYNAIQ
jgi:hypothetical protein